MQKLLWVGNPFFKTALEHLNIFQVKSYDFKSPEILIWKDLIAIANFEPDILVVADKSMPPFVLGMEDFPCLTVFYAVDSHIQSWYPYYAQGFDLCLLSLKDHIPNFIGPNLPRERIFWYPPFAQDHLYPDTENATPKIWDALFVGRVNDTTPKRQIFIEALKNRISNFHSTFGDYAKLFPQAKVVLNFCEHGDLNFRVFEAQGMGSALVTPRIGNGQNSLFTNRTHYLLYDLNSIDSCISAINELLTNENLRTKLENNGLALINEKHRAKHRAQSFAKLLESFVPKASKIIEQRLKRAPLIRKQNLRLPYLLWADSMDDPKAQSLLLKAASKEGLNPKV